MQFETQPVPEGPPFPCDEATFRALAETFVPETQEFAGPEWSQLYRIIAQALKPRPARIKRQLSAFVRLLNLRSLLRYQRRYARLSAGRRLRLLQSIERSRLVLLRNGLWGLRTLVLMGYYGRPEAVQQIGYRADRRGWQRQETEP
jgi:hypothetical protein